jgi:hypothetical protein
VICGKRGKGCYFDERSVTRYCRYKKEAERKELNALILKDLKRSGLDQHDAKRMGVVPLTREQSIDRGFSPRPGYLIPYRDVQGKPLGLDASRVRYLDDTGHRYGQRAGTLCHIYLPPSIDWRKIAANPKVEFVITEGEKKAMALVKAGFIAIAIGGVSAFSAKKKGIPDLIPDFDWFEWRGRGVVILFDSNIEWNPAVRIAAEMLSTRLTARRAIVRVARIPNDDIGEYDERKSVGADDYLVAHNAKEMRALIDGAALTTSQQELHNANDRFAFINTPVGILSIDDRQLLTRANFNLLLANEKIAVPTSGGVKLVPLAEEWLEWPHRRTHPRIVYEPLQPFVLEDGSFNRYAPPKITPREPTKRELELYKKLRDFLFHRSPEVIPWFEGWAAYAMITGRKLIHAVIVQGGTKGTGKSLLGRLIEGCYGHNGALLSAEQLSQPFNAWAVDKQFIVGDEILGDERRKGMDLLKNLITQEAIEINTKYAPQYVVDSHANFFFTSNHPDAIRLDDDERRFLVIGVGHETPLRPALYRECVEWMASGRAAEAMTYYFTRMVDVSAYDSMVGEAPRTEALAEMAEHGDTPIKRWLRNLLANPDEHLKIGAAPVSGELFTCEELADYYGRTLGSGGIAPPSFNPHAAQTAIGITLAVLKVLLIRLHKKDCGVNKKLYAIRNRDEWRSLMGRDGVALQRRALREWKRWRRDESIYDLLQGGKLPSTTPTTRTTPTTPLS